MSGFLYYLLTFAESIASVFGLHFAYDQPRYSVIQNLGESVEIRRYEPRAAIEAMVRGQDPEKATSEAFTLLFRYITGANRSQQKIGMTTPVRPGHPERIAMTAPVQTMTSSGDVSMRFFLPRASNVDSAPVPLDPRLRLVQMTDTTLAVVRYSGSPTKAARDHHAATLLSLLAKSDWQPAGDVFQLTYDPPFTIPFLRRNEVAVAIVGANR